MDERQTIAFLGLGVMGAPMAGHLARAGHRVTVYNRTAARAEDWRRRHAAEGLEVVRARGLDLPVTETVDQLYAEVQAMGGGRQDTSALIRHLPEVGA